MWKNGVNAINCGDDDPEGEWGFSIAIQGLRGFPEEKSLSGRGRAFGMNGFPEVCATLSQFSQLNHYFYILPIQCRLYSAAILLFSSLFSFSLLISKTLTQASQYIYIGEQFRWRKK